MGIETQRSFLSPFSVMHSYEVRWTRVSPGFTGLESKLEQLTDRDVVMMELLATCRIATSGQLGKAFWGNPRSAAGRLKMLARFGALTRHDLVGRRLTLILYTLGPLSAMVLNSTFHQWWLGQGAVPTLAQLVTTQLYLRMRTLGPAVFYPTPPPFSGIIRLGAAEYAVVAARNADVDFKKARAQRLLVVGETVRQLLSLAPGIQEGARFTTDERLFTLPLEQVFMRYNAAGGKLEEEVVAFRKAPEKPLEEQAEAK